MLHVSAGIVKGLQGITDADPAVAVIRDAGAAQQRVWTATVSTVAQATQGESLSPSIIVVGGAVGLKQAGTEQAGSVSQQT